MNRLATVDRDDPVAIAPGVIFRGAPAQIINLPTYVKAATGAIVVFAAYLYALMRWPVPWFARRRDRADRTRCRDGSPAHGVHGGQLDPARITCRQGILNRRLQSLKLFRIQGVASLHPW